MTKYTDEYVTPESRSINLKYLIGVLIILAFVIYSVFFTPDEDYRLTALEVCPAAIAEMNSSEGPWIRVSVPGLENERELWIEANDDFYSQHYTNDQVGILLGKYDQLEVMKKEGKTYRRLKRQVWGVEEIYNTIEEAKAANPVKKYTTIGTIVSKNAKADKLYLVVELEGKKAETIVDKQLADQLHVGDKVQGEFESIGEFTRFIGVNKP